MIVFELICGKSHRFEGWFASPDDFGKQKHAGLLECPRCGSKTVEKLLTSKLRKQESRQHKAAKQPVAQLSAAKLHEMIDYILANTENVGPKFATEARRIHNGEAPTRDIRGTATREETEELADEGIPVVPLPIPPGDVH
jgi:hypothetical protein